MDLRYQNILSHRYSNCISELHSNACF